MNHICGRCGKTFEGEGLGFCPYCGEKLVPAAAEPAEPADGEAMEWIRKAQAVASYPDKKKILLKGLEACPDSREILWELLFIGEEPPKRARNMVFAVIRCFVLEIYRDPRSFPETRREEMRAYLYDAPQLVRVLRMFDDPEKKQQEYLQRLCGEYLEIFLEGDSRVRGSIFGFSIERNRDKRLAAAVADVIRNMRADEKLSPEQREQLWKAMYRAYAARNNGRTEHLDEQLSRVSG